MISYDDFKKVEIRAGKILSAEKVPETDKLIKLSVDFGETKEVISMCFNPVWASASIKRILSQATTICSSYKWVELKIFPTGSVISEIPVLAERIKGFRSSADRTTAIIAC